MSAEQLQLVHCSSCGMDAYPSLNLRGDMVPKMVPCCPGCGIEHASVSTDDMTQTPVVTDRKAAPVVQMSAYRTPAPTADPEQMIRDRLLFLDMELAKLDGYNKERRRLRRMLKAAGDST